MNMRHMLFSVQRCAQLLNCSVANAVRRLSGEPDHADTLCCNHCPDPSVCLLPGVVRPLNTATLANSRKMLRVLRKPKTGGRAAIPVRARVHGVCVRQKPTAIRQPLVLSARNSLCSSDLTLVSAGSTGADGRPTRAVQLSWSRP